MKKYTLVLILSCLIWVSHVHGIDEEPESIDLDPCAGTECSGLFQVSVPPFCECVCPSDMGRSCPPNKDFDDNICECLCRDINSECPGKSDFNFVICNCVCPLHEEDCGPGEELDRSECSCVGPPPTTTTPTLPPTQQPPSPGCSLAAELECQGEDQYLDPDTCQCQCHRFLIKKTYHSHYYRHHRSMYEPYFELPNNEEEEGSRFTRSNKSGSKSGSKSSRRTSGSKSSRRKSGSKSSRRTSGSKSGSTSRNGPKPEVPAVVGDVQTFYSQSCPAWKKADYKNCICYW